MPLKISKRRGSPYWQITGTVAEQPVRRSAKTSDRETAERIKTELEAKMHREALYGKANESTFPQACVLYLKERDRSEFDRKQIVLFLRGKLAGMRLDAIKPGMVRTLAREMYPGNAPQSLNRLVVAPVQAIINCAAGHGLCSRISVKKYKPEGERVKFDVDREWIDAFMAHASPHLGAVALFQYQTGVRPHEALRLKPGDIDFKDKVAIIRRTKQGWPHRASLTKEMTSILRTLPPVELQSGGHKGEVRVFGWTQPRGLRVPYQTACKAAGIPYRTPYEAGRHSYATECVVRRGMDIPTVAKAGNFSPEILLRRYAHAKRVKELAEEVFGTKSTHDRTSKLK